MVDIGSVDHGFSISGAEAFKNKIHQEAIEDTKTQLGQIENIRTTIQSGWAGKSQENFMANFQTNVEKVQKALDELDLALSNELDNIKSAWMEQDNEMVQLEQ